MRTAIAILLFTSLSFQCFVKLGVVVWFNYNRAYIAKNLCENRGKPQMKCCGKCYLKKKLDKVNEGQGRAGNLPVKWEKGEMPMFLVTAPFTFCNVSAVKNSLVHQAIYGLFLISQPHPSVFHPPSAAA